MPFHTWLMSQTLEALEELDEKGILTAMETAWQAGMQEGYRQGYTIAKMTEALQPQLPKDTN